MDDNLSKLLQTDNYQGGVIYTNSVSVNDDHGYYMRYIVNEINDLKYWIKDDVRATYMNELLKNQIDLLNQILINLNKTRKNS